VLRTEVAAISLGPVGSQLLLDLSYEEDSSADADFNIVMTGNGRLVEVQGTAERQTFTRHDMNAVLDLAEKGIEQLLTLQRQAIQRALAAGD
jgi:ribonuclease PH